LVSLLKRNHIKSVLITAAAFLVLIFFNRKIIIFYFSKITFYHHRSKRSPDLPSPTSTSGATAATAAATAQTPVVPANPEEEALAPRSSKSLDKSEAESSPASASSLATAPRQSRGWCKDSYGVFCMIYNAFNGNEEKVINLKKTPSRTVQGQNTFQTYYILHEKLTH